MPRLEHWFYNHCAFVIALAFISSSCDFQQQLESYNQDDLMIGETGLW